LAILMTTLSLAACSPGQPAETPAAPETFEVRVEPGELEIAAGRTASLAAEADDSRGQPIGGAHFRFATPDPRLLQVRQDGSVTALGPAGEASVLITSGRVERRVPVRIVPGPLARIQILEGDALTVVAGRASAGRLVARVADAFGNPVARVPLNLALGADDPDVPVGTTDAGGAVVFDLPAVSTAGAMPLKLTSPAAPALQAVVTLTVRPAPGATITALTGSPLVVEDVGAARRAALQWQVRDAFGNPVAGAPVGFRVQRGPGGLDPAEGETNVDGVVTSIWTGTPGTAAGVDIEAALRSDPPALSVLTLPLRADPARRAGSARPPRAATKR
jgi:hypothetical protein